MNSNQLIITCGQEHIVFFFFFCVFDSFLPTTSIHAIRQIYIIAICFFIVLFYFVFSLLFFCVFVFLSICCVLQFESVLVVVFWQHNRCFLTSLDDTKLTIFVPFTFFNNFKWPNYTWMIITKSMAHQKLFN